MIKVPMAPEKVHILDDSHTRLGVGQTGQYIYPISKCCGVRADRRKESFDGETISNSFYCCYCDGELEEYSGHEPDFVEINKGYTHVDEYVLAIAVYNWTGIEPIDFRIEITE